jgi:hypothetical protein
MLPFHEAIVLGSTMIRPQPGVRGGKYAGLDFGCALGMADTACGAFAESAYPWITHQVPVPCSCRENASLLVRPSERGAQINSIVAHIFDTHIFGLGGDWTFEELIDWIKSVSPVQAAQEETNEHPECVLQEQGR